MKNFEDAPIERKEVVRPVADGSQFIKDNMMKSVNRNEQVRQAVREWLFSFEGGMTRKAFDQQMKRLDFDDDIAISQLAKADGRRVIPLPPPPEMPKLEKPLIEQMVEDSYVAVYGRKFKEAIHDAVKDLKTCGSVYVLQVEHLLLEFVDYEHRGKSADMIQSALDADFLIIVDLEMPIHLTWHVHEAISRIGRMRAEAKKPIISTWCRFNDCNDFFERFKIYNAK